MGKVAASTYTIASALLYIGDEPIIRTVNTCTRVFSASGRAVVRAGV